MILTDSGLPIVLNEKDGSLSFEDGLLCDGSSTKTLGQMEGLYRDSSSTDPDTLAYRAYRNIRFAEDEDAWVGRGLRYDITVVLSGTVNGEFFKTSGHYHGFPEGASNPYPEVYEVIAGEIVFVLQKNRRFDQGVEKDFDYVRAVHVKAGEAIIIPPFCGHGSINPTDGVSAFSNIAAVACENSYDPIKLHHGLAAYVTDDGNGGFACEKNAHYEGVAEAKIVRAREAADLGIQFGMPCYGAYLRHPEHYDYMLNPDPYAAQLDALVQ